MRQRAVTFVEHYTDDFITLGKPRSDECQANPHVMLEMCEAKGVPITAEKSEGPSTSLVFLGIEIESHNMEMTLPPEKLSNLRESLAV